MAYNELFYIKLAKFGKDRIIEKHRYSGLISECDEWLIREFIGEQ